MSTLACTRENPAFEGDDDVLAEGDTGATDGTDGTGTETGVAECEYDEGQELVIELPMPCGETNDQTQRYERSFLVLSEAQDGKGWLGGLCEVGDLDCTGDCPTNVPQAVVVGPFDVTGLVGGGACLRISAEQGDPSVDSCNFDAIGIWHLDKPIVMASNGAAVIGEALDDAGQIQPVPVLAESPACECSDGCCARGDHRFDIGGQKVAVGTSVHLEAYPYDFHPLHAYNPTGCAGDLKQAWGLTYSP